MKKIFILIIGILFLVSVISFATVVPQMYQTARGMAMGGVYINTSNNETSLLYNPAMLGKVKKFKVQIIPEFTIGVNDNAINIFNKMKDVPKNIDGKSEAQIFSYLSNLSNDLNNQMASLYEGTYMGFAMPYFGVAAFVYVDLYQLGVENPVSPQIKASGEATFTIPVGFAMKVPDFSFLKHNYVGLSLRYIMSGSMYTNGVSVMTLADQSNINDFDTTMALLNGQKSAGYSATVSATTGTKKLQYSVVIQNLVSSLSVSKYEMNNTTKKGYVTDIGHQSYPTEVDFGVSSQITKTLLVAGDVDNVFSNVQTLSGSYGNVWRKIHIGAEYHPWSNIFNLKLRAGINEGYLTYGLGARPFEFLNTIPILGFISGMNLNYAYYTSETGMQIGDAPDHMQTVSFSLGF